jgi:hypothetical protein
VWYSGESLNDAQTLLQSSRIFATTRKKIS